MTQKPAITILGAGRLGSALADLANAAGYPLAAVTTGRQATAQAFTEKTGFSAACDNVTAAARGDLILLTVPDRFILTVLEELVGGRRLRPGQILLHTSGVATGEILMPARQFGVAVGSMHPLQSFADRETACQNLPGSAFAIDGDPAAVAAARRLAGDLGGRILDVPPEERILYHAAACIASNYLVALLSAAEKLIARWSSKRQDAIAALLPLVTGTLRNVERQGAAAALTGPIVRGDAETVSRHLAALPEEYLQLYQCLGQAALKLAGDRIPPAERSSLNTLLTGAGQSNERRLHLCQKSE